MPERRDNVPRRHKRSFKDVLEGLLGRRAADPLQKALSELARPILFTAIVLLFVLILCWHPSKGLLLVLFLLFLVFIGLTG